MSHDGEYEIKSEIEKRKVHTEIAKKAFRKTIDKIANSGIIYHYKLNDSKEFDERLNSGEMESNWFKTKDGYYIKVEKKKEDKYRIYYIDDDKYRYHTFKYYELIAHYNPEPSYQPENSNLYKKNRNVFSRNKQSVKFKHGHVSIGGKRKSARMTKRRKSRKNKKTNKRRN